MRLVLSERVSGGGSGGGSSSGWRDPTADAMHATSGKTTILALILRLQLPPRRIRSRTAANHASLSSRARAASNIRISTSHYKTKTVMFL